MKSFESLTREKKNLLLKFPAYISLLASNADGEMDDGEKKKAIELTHIKTYAAEARLRDFFVEAEKQFKANITQLNKSLPGEHQARKQAINSALEDISVILKELDDGYAAALRRSMQSYKDHVSKAHRNLLEYFVFPFPLKGISDL